MKNNYDVVIVGAGVAGMTAAIYLKRANVNCLLVEKYVPGGQVMNTSTIENYPGFKKITGPDFIMNIMEQLKELEVPFEYDEVEQIIDNKEYKIVKTKNKEITCKGIILSLGRIPRKLEVPQENELTGKGISWCAICDGPLYKNKEVLVVGGGNSSLEESLYLSEICKKVTIVHRRDYFTAQEHLIEKIKNKKNIKVLFNTEVKEFIEKDNKLHSVIIFDNKKEKLKKIKVEGCFIYIGFLPNTKDFSNLDILDEEGYIKADSSLRTDIDFIYASGDVVKKDLYQIVTAVSDGAKAASSYIEDVRKRG